MDDSFLQSFLYISCFILDLLILLIIGLWHQASSKKERSDQQEKPTCTSVDGFNENAFQC